MYWFPTVNFVVALGGLGMLAFTLGLLVDYYCCRSAYTRRWFQSWLWPLILLTTLLGVAIALLYSEYFGIVPCSLCWLQRIALFPQLVLAFFAFKIKDTVYFPRYGIVLSIFGLVIALYHYVYQLVPETVRSGGVMPCLVDGTSDCATKVIDEFGFMTFPLLSAITFAFLISLYLHLRRIEG